MAKRRRRKKNPSQMHPLLTLKRGIVWAQKWNAHRRTEAARLDRESRAASKAVKTAKTEKSAQRDAARLARIKAGAEREQAKKAGPQVVRVARPSAAQQAKAGTGTTATVKRPAKKVPAPQQPVARPVAAGATPVGLCGHKTDDGKECTHPVTKGGRCAAGHTNGMRRSVNGQTSAWAAKPAKKAVAAGPAQRPAGPDRDHYDARGRLKPEHFGPECSCCGMHHGTNTRPGHCGWCRDKNHPLRKA